MKRSLSDLDEELAYNLCETYGKSQTKVAEFLGVGQATISRIVKEQKLKQEIYSRESQLSAAAAAGFKSFYEEQFAKSPKVIEASELLQKRSSLLDSNQNEED